MRLFHGTTVDNMLSILENGFNSARTNWTVSEEDKTYFFTEEFFNKEYDINSDEDLLGRAIPYTMEQARITLCVQNPKDYRAAVLVFESEYMDNGSETEPDTSCGDNMEDCAVSLANPDMKGLVAVYIMKHDESSTRLLWLSTMIGREYLSEVEMSPIERAVVNQLSNTSFEVMYELDDNNEFIEYQFKKESILKKAA